MKVSDSYLNCPKCKGCGFKIKHVWDMSNDSLKLKCGKENCGEWSELRDWKQATSARWFAIAETLKGAK